MTNILTRRYTADTADLAEQCKKALEVHFGEIPMPRNYTKSKAVKSKAVKSKAVKSKAVKRKIVIKRKDIRNIRKQNLPIFF